MNWYLEAIEKYAMFDGRARRKEYWYFMSFNILISIVLIIIDVVIGTASLGGVGLLSGIYTLAVLIPGIAVSVRRLHDTNRNGWWMLIGLIPLIGGIVLLVFMVQDSQPGENQYGPNPKVIANASSAAATIYNSSLSAGRQHTDIDDEHIYATIAKELETGVVDKGLWTRLFAELGGDEKQTKVRYIKHRADRLISAERTRLEQAVHEHAAEAVRLEQLRRNIKKNQERMVPVKAGRFKWCCTKCATANWNHVEICKFCGSGKNGVVIDTRRYERVTKSEQRTDSNKCPKCGLYSPPASLRCDCGYAFA